MSDYDSASGHLPSLQDGQERPVPPVPDGSGLARYHVPPFSVFDTRQGYWQDRKRLWLALGIQSEIGRPGNLTYGKFDQSYLGPQTKARYGDGSTSVFDPVLTEIVYRWFCPSGGTILDPFAGGSVRGLVAACLLFPYIGIELRGVQVEVNRDQADRILQPDAPTPVWINGDSNSVLASDPGIPPVDLVFTSPPYGDLERYSDDPADLSNMKPDEFADTYRRILRHAVNRLRDDRFAVVVVSNIRDKNGDIRDLVGLTCKGMADAGAPLYNDAILLNASGTAALRVRQPFDASRKLVRVHQQVLIFCKGDARKAAAAISRTAAVQS